MTHPLDMLRHHVTGAIERGQAVPIVGIPAQHTYSLIVGNIGQTWSGTNGAQALREYGQAKASAAKPGGRDGWEPVTLFRDGEPWHEFNPGPFWFVELTDTFGGEANYSWVTRVKVQARTLAHAVRRFSKDAGFVGRVRFDLDDGTSARYNVRGAALCFFVSAWDDEKHSDYLHIREL